MDKTGLIVSIVTIVALFAGPALAVWWGNSLQSKNQEQQLRSDDTLRKGNQEQKQRVELFSTLMASRADPLSMDRIRALALIDVVFYKDEVVRQKWREWHEAITNSSLNDAKGWEIRNLKFYDLLTEMARAVGFERLSANEMQRLYSPEAFLVNARLQAAQGLEFYRVLKNSQDFGKPRTDEPTKLPLGEPPIF